MASGLKEIRSKPWFFGRDSSWVLMLLHFPGMEPFEQQDQPVTKELLALPKEFLVREKILIRDKLKELLNESK
jgi:hypothetical protein